MVFPSVPVYLDPLNWNQQAHQQGSSGGGGGGPSSQLPPGMSAPGMAGSIRPGSMTDRARLAKIPQPEPGLRCPRCDSTNTKFCYFNNYSLSQPRHFCKTCRRYWTRGGALRNVPVGGGCRRNRRTKSSAGSSSKSSTTTQQITGTASSSPCTATYSGVHGAITSHVPFPSQLPLMASLHPLPDFAATNYGMSFSGIQPAGSTVDYQLGGSNIGLENLRLQQMQQFPLLGGLELPPPPPLPPPAAASGLHPFGGEGSGFLGGIFAGQAQEKTSGSGFTIEPASSVKMEDNQQLLNFPRQYLGVSRSDQFWSVGSDGGSSSGAGGWLTDF